MRCACAERRAEGSSGSIGVQQLVRKNLHRHDLRRKPRAGDRLRDRRLSAGTGAGRGRIPPRSRAARDREARYTSQRHEADEVEILSGVFEGTHDRHADRAADPQHRCAVEGLRRHRRHVPARPRRLHLSGRNTASAISAAAGVRPRAKRRCASRPASSRRSISRKIRRRARLAAPSSVSSRARSTGMPSKSNPFFWPDAAMVPELENYITALRKSGDSVGARVNVVAENVPPGWGEPIYGKLDGELAVGADVDQRGQGRRDRRRLRRRRAAWQRASRRDHAAGFPLEPCRRHSRRHFDRPGGRRLDGAEADLEHSDSRTQREPGRRAGRGRDQGPPRSVRRHPRDADRRGDDGARADGPGAAASRAMRRRRRRHAAIPGSKT